LILKNKTAKVEKSLDELPARLLQFAELYANGMSMMQAAKKCGFKPSTCKAHSHTWVGKTRESSRYPALWDYYQKLRKEKLRIYEVSQQSVIEELKIIAFAKIDNYLDLPQKAVQDKLDKLLREQLEANEALERWMIDQKREEEAILRYEAAEDEDEETLDEFGRGGWRKAPKKKSPKRFVDAPKEMVDRLRKVNDAIRDLSKQSGYTLRLKWLEDIPPELMPAIQEIKQTRDGISVKLYNKLEALEMFAKYTRMYEAQDDNDKPTEIKELNIIVNGSKSPLLDELLKGDAQ
jgi:hypothetical protein